jgi:hypothetical protein
MKSLQRTFAAFVAACLMSAAAFAADATGTWKWTQQGRGGKSGSSTPREATLTVVQKDGKLTGSVSSPGRDGGTSTAEIANATIKGDMVAFSVERTFGNNKYVVKYAGKIAGDTITGEYETPGRDGQSTKREWIAKRAK